MFGFWTTVLEGGMNLLAVFVEPCSRRGGKLLSAQTRRLCQEDSVKNTCI